MINMKKISEKPDLKTGFLRYKKTMNYIIQSFIFLLCGVLVTTNPCFAQLEDIVLGGKAICIVSGKSPVKRFTADGNRLLILQGEGIASGSIQLQLIKTVQPHNPILIDINILALLGQIDNLDSFLNGEVFNFENNTSEISISKTNNNTTFQVTNLISEEESSNITGKIKLQSNSDNTLNGILNIKVNDILFLKDSEEINSKGNNGNLNIRCKLQDIPIEIKNQ